MRILFIADIVGKIGRRAIQKLLPELKTELKPDFVIANAENIAHGTGVTQSTLTELIEAGVDFFTSGNHILSKPEALEILSDPDSVLIRPANYPSTMAGVGFKIVEVKGNSVLIINLLGQVFMREGPGSPFKKLDEILATLKDQPLAAIIVDFHAEATSEKVAFGWYADGRVSAVLGTHTHVPTADPKILPQGTAYITDVGMVGATESVIGDDKELIIESFVKQTPHKIEIPKSGEVELGAVLVEIDPKTKKAIKIDRLDRKIEV